VRTAPGSGGKHNTRPSASEVREERRTLPRAHADRVPFAVVKTTKSINPIPCSPLVRKLRCRRRAVCAYHDPQSGRGHV
jgi:hypothetical protein